MYIGLMDKFSRNTELKRFNNYKQQLLDKGLSEQKAEYGATIAWLNAFALPFPFEEIPDIDFFILMINQDDRRKNVCLRILQTIDKQAKDLTKEDIVLIQSIKGAEEIDLPVIRILQDNSGA